MITILDIMTKKGLKEAGLIGKSIYELNYREESIFGDEVKPNKTIPATNRPNQSRRIFDPRKGFVTKKYNQYYASITVDANLIITKIT